MNGEEIFVRDNGTVRVECLADGIPTPSVRWQKKWHNGELLLIEEGPSLIVENFTPEKEVFISENFYLRTFASNRVNIFARQKISRGVQKLMWN